MVILEVGEFTRVEGNGKAEIVIENREVKEVRVKIVEGPRFFELLTLGRYYWDVPDLEARICAICYLAHSFASVLGIEKAFGVKVPEEIQLLRELGLIGEFLESHALHLYLLVAPDLFGYPDAIRMVSKHGELVKEGLTIKSFGNYIREIIGGREIHGINIKPGGFGRYPTADELEKIEKSCDELLRMAKRAVNIFATQDVFGAVPVYHIATDEYLYGEKLIASDGERFDYLEHIEEKTLPYSFAKQSKYKGEIFMVGALSRLMLKADKLTPMAKELFEQHKEKLSQGYVSLNNLAQAIELVYAIERAKEIVSTLLDRGIKGENVPIEPKEGEGIGYVEAPRGVLIHHYKIDGNGNITYSNIITPTALNHALMELSLYEETKKNYGTLDENSLTHRLEETVRAFDPCISCSVHLVRL
ncbi:Ni/Fe hydrogenase subunit alpha [Thermococcus sp. M39]|uniref:NAD(P)-dependent hydrogenase/sulfhydrogenase 2 subunit alpha n=1 Tax=unclassified Thermococcus TaxID=2627626 RepID=UPI0014393EED|nr:MULTISPECIES: NAD(P)-dependent hydrogenase/sulfhydrogenase 2 subunit alpha [unclassified Thermococcus]NJE07167.1 Ni/Fe hydrogenase subunit alpha [Thermococcus sp. M39]NJE12701.1 Ni/Fe hydrogenase subunit alpha [Thermococcus sp. LS2]